MYVEDLSVGVRMLESRARIAKLAIYTWMAFQLLGFGFQARFMLGEPPDEALLGLGQTIDYLTLGMFLVSAVAISFWIHRAHENLRLFTSGPFEFSGQSAVFWFFVPFANLVQPFRAMRELWSSSRGPAGGGSASTRMVDGWWGCFIVGGLFSNIGARLLEAAASSDSQLSALALFDLGEVLRLCSAILLHEIIRGVGRMQLQQVTVGEVFS
ncbi:MAG: DUF4328 domain-containing protein [Sphingomonadales bacterium]|nr:DUF4328 domain-containing protein [Sphingomonadaceae bacterium]MBS3929665.1 DUF4328 domain-containing protein [Sphingomonadales bacterium]